jgi:hypothetical protein
MIFKNLMHRILRLIAKTGLIAEPRAPFYSYAAKHRRKLMTKDYSGGLTYAQACERYT